MRLNKDIDKMIAKVAAGMVAGGLVMPEEAEAMYVGPSATGWAKLGNKFTSLMDRKVRAEISDAGAKWKVSPTMGEFAPYSHSGKPRYLGDLIEHKDLFQNYPELRNAPVYIDPVTRKGGNMKMGIGPDLQPRPEITLGDLEFVGTTGESPKATILHEIQHAIQEKEGWARGGNPQQLAAEGVIPPSLRGREAILKQRLAEIESMVPRKKGVDAVNEFWGDNLGLLGEQQRLEKELFDLPTSGTYEAYKHLSGEIEARDTAARMGLSAAERAKQLPYSGQGIPLKDTITKMEGGGAASVKQPWETMDVVWGINTPYTAHYSPMQGTITVNPEEFAKLSKYKRYDKPAQETVVQHERLHAFWDSFLPRDQKKPLLDELSVIEKSPRVDPTSGGVGERAIETLTVFKVNKSLLNDKERLWAEKALSVGHSLPIHKGATPLQESIKKMGVAAPVGAILAERMAQRKSQAEAWEGQGLEDAVNPVEYLIPGRWGGGAINMLIDTATGMVLGR